MSEPGAEQTQPFPEGTAGGPTPEPPARGTRVAAFFGGLSLAAFFGGLGLSILRAPINDADVPPWAGWALRAFIFLMFGTITGLGLYGVWFGIRGPGAPRIPAPMLDRCPACGEARPRRAGRRAAPPWSACAFCGGAPDALAAWWRETPREGLGGVLFAAGIGGALLSLGFVVAASALHAEARPFLIVAYLALALLLSVVGAAMLFGGALSARDVLRQRRRRVFTLGVHEGGKTITASATLEAGKLSLRGGTLRLLALEDVVDEVPHEVALPGLPASVARTLAVLHARGELSLSHAEQTAWTLPDRGELARSHEVDVQVVARSSPVEVPVDARDLVLHALAERPTAREIAAALRVNDDLRNAFEVYAGRLPADEADPRTLRLLAAVLRGEEATVPYRQRG